MNQDLYFRVTSVTSYSASFQWSPLPDIPVRLKSHYGYILQVRDFKTGDEVRNLSMAVDITKVTVNLQPGSDYSFLLKAYRLHGDALETTNISGLINARILQADKKQGERLASAIGLSSGIYPFPI